MSATTYLKNAILNSQFRNDPYAIPTMLYVGLSKTAPNDLGTNCTEPTSASYKRLEIASNAVNWEEATEGSITNTATLRFNEAEESWTTQAAPITHWAIFDASTGGNMLYYGQLTKSQEIPRGSILEIPENGLTTTIVNQ